MAMFNVQRAVTPKVGKPELEFMCSARRLIVLYICVEFRENISDGIRVIERTRMIEALTDGWTVVPKFRHLLGIFCVKQNTQQYVKITI